MSIQSRSKEIRRRGFLALVVAVIVSVCALAAYARGWLSPRSSALPASAPAQDDPQPGRRVRSQIEVEVVTITPRGIEPAEITRPAGRFLLVVDNRSDLEGVTLRLDRETGARMHEVPMAREKWDWNQVVDLQPGSYLLTEADHQDWLCRITITAQ